MTGLQSGAVLIAVLWLTGQDGNILLYYIGKKLHKKRNLRGATEGLREAHAHSRASSR